MPMREEEDVAELLSRSRSDLLYCLAKAGGFLLLSPMSWEGVWMPSRECLVEQCL